MRSQNLLNKRSEFLIISIGLSFYQTYWFILISVSLLVDSEERCIGWYDIMKDL